MKGQNRSSAVMEQRREHSMDSLNYFPTPPWATRALCEHVIPHWNLHNLTCLEPAAGAGDMVRPLSQYFRSVTGSDVHDHGAGFPVVDYLTLRPYEPKSFDWVITNPPFRLAKEFILQSLEVSRYGVAMLTRIAFLEGVKRLREIYSRNPPAYVGVFAERVPMFEGRLEEEGKSATCYVWLVWEKRNEGTTQLIWIPSCRKTLEREDDYPCHTKSNPLPGSETQQATLNV